MVHSHDAKCSPDGRCVAYASDELGSALANSQSKWLRTRSLDHDRGCPVFPPVDTPPRLTARGASQGGCPQTARRSYRDSDRTGFAQTLAASLRHRSHTPLLTGGFGYLHPFLALTYMNVFFSADSAKLKTASRSTLGPTRLQAVSQAGDSL